MTKVLEIFKVLFPSFFTNGKKWLGARALTIDDFKVEVIEAKKDEILQHFVKGYGDFPRISVRITMKDSTIKMLDKMEYFINRHKKTFDELSEREKIEMTSSHKDVTLNLRKRCRTENGGILRSEAKIERVIDSLIVELRDLFDKSKDGLVAEMIEDVNKRVQHIVSENNRMYRNGVFPALTERKTLDELLELNSKSKDVEKLKMEHEVEKGKLDAEIEVYKKKIAELEDKKTEVYVSTRDKLFGDKIETLPDDIKEELKKASPYPKVSRGFPF